MPVAAFYFSALALGFAGSFHCIGMCGPLMMSLPLAGFSPKGKIAGLMLYHTGRIVSYAMLGLVCGLVGAQVYLSGYQQWLSILLGIAILLYYIVRLAGIRRVPVKRIGGAWLQNRMIRYLSAPSYQHLLLAGIANGLLPCGMVYLALASALSVHYPPAASGFMAAYGAGTVPMMAFLYFSGTLVNVRVRNRIRKAVPVLAIFIGCLLILRGCNLGIPYISPAAATGGPGISCPR